MCKFKIKFLNIPYNLPKNGKVSSGYIVIVDALVAFFDKFIVVIEERYFTLNSHIITFKLQINF